MFKAILLSMLSLITINVAVAQRSLDSLKSEEKFDLFYKLYFTEINKLESTIDVFGLAEGHHWQITGGPAKYKEHILKKITKRVNIENPEKKDSNSINIASLVKIENYLHEQYFNGLRLFSVEKVGEEYKFIVYEEAVKK